MHNITKRLLIALSAILILSAPSFAQQPAPAQRSESDFVTEKGFNSKVFEVKYRDPDSLAKVLRQLGSGFKGASISANSEFKTLTVRDFPENLATMEEALKRLDSPGAPRPNIELHMYVLVASNTTASVPPAYTDIPAELKDVVTQLRETLRYKNYDLAAAVVQRLTETERGLRGKGTMEISKSATPAGNATVNYDYFINSLTLAPASSGAQTIQIGEFTFATVLSTPMQDIRAQVQTALNLRSGEKVVVGTATLGDRALIVVLTAKLLS